MTLNELSALIKERKSFLCVGLDSDISKIPTHLLTLDDPVFEFNKAIVDATIDLAIAFKPNIAFYESRGIDGWKSLIKTIQYIKSLNKPVFTIADAKRADIGNTSKQYAKTFFDPASSGMDFDAVTVAPYMGTDSIEPFLSYKNKWSVILTLTSNPGSADFQTCQRNSYSALERLGIKTQQKQLFEQVLQKSYDWGNEDQIMFVVGATKAEMLKEIRKIVPYHFLLVPGVGAQGGSLADVMNFGYNNHGGLLINASRSIIFASGGMDFAEKAHQEALIMQREMEDFIISH